MPRRSSGGASRAEEPDDAVQNVLMLDEFPAIRLLDPSTHSSDKAILVLEHARNGVFHQLLSVFPASRCCLLEADFDLRREVNFHTPSGYGTNEHGGKPGRRACPESFVVGAWACFP